MAAVYDWIKANIVNVINFVAGEYWGNSLVLFVIFVSCVTLLFLNKDKIRRSYNILAVYSELLIVLILLNPMPLKFYKDTRDTFALLPMCMIIACIIAINSKDLLGRVKRNAVIVGLAILIVIVSLSIQKDTMVNAINRYKVDDQGVLIAKCVLQESNNEPVYVCYILRDGEHHGEDVSAFEVAEQYSGLIRAEVALNPDDPIIAEAEYLVVNNEMLDVVNDDLSGFEQTANTGCYSVLSNMQLQ